MFYRFECFNRTKKVYLINLGKTLKRCGWALVINVCMLSLSVYAQQSNSLAIGAAKVDFTDWAESRNDQMEGFNDRIYSRAIVIKNGTTSSALVSVDIGAIRDETWKNVSATVEKELGIPTENLIITATHTHSVPFLAGKELENHIIESVRQASQKTKSGKMSLGSGESYINVNRNITVKETGRWWEGANYDGVSDKTVDVVYFTDEKDNPIAALYNYAMHAVIAGQLDQISGDVPGAASRYIEESMGDDFVALWSEGAAGDQNPIFFQQTYDLRDIRVKEYAKRGEDISNAMPPGGVGLDRNNHRVALLMNQQKQMLLSMGQMLGEEVLHTIRNNMERPRSHAEISGHNKSIQCPGRKRLDKGRAGYPGEYTDGEDVTIRLSLLRIDQLMIGGVNGEVFNAIAQRFKQESPYKHSIMSTLTNGTANSGYIPSDEAFGYHTFEVLSSRLKPGCAENSIVEGLLDLIDEAENL